MRSALIVGLLVCGAFALLGLPRALSNADFIYMCLAAALAAKGHILSTPYFPPGYPLLLLGLVSCGLSALSAGCLLSAIGSGLSAAAVSYCARLWEIPSAPAFLFGLLAVSLPSVFIIALNPHLDALYTGLALLLIAAALRAFSGKHGLAVYLAALLPAVLLISLRYHAVLLVIPLALALIFTPKRKDGSGTLGLGLTLLLVGALSCAGSLYLLQQQSGSLETAASLQIATGAVYREGLAPGPPSFMELLSGSPEARENPAVTAMFDDYAGWLRTSPEAEWPEILGGVVHNWPIFLTRRAVVAGIVLFILLGLIRQRTPAGSGWLLAFIPLYTLALSPTYFTQRASALPELCGLLLAVAAASLCFPTLAEHKRNRMRTKHAGKRVDPALLGGALSLLILAATAYGIWREVPVLREQRARHKQWLAADEVALKAAGGHRESLFGAPHRTCLISTDNRFSLPGPSYSRLWLDDPRVATQIDALWPRLDWEAALRGEGAIQAVILSPDDPSRASRFMLEAIAASPDWEAAGSVGSARVWRRRAH